MTSNSFLGIGRAQLHYGCCSFSRPCFSYQTAPPGFCYEAYGLHVYVLYQVLGVWEAACLSPAHLCLYLCHLPGSRKQSFLRA